MFRLMLTAVALAVSGAAVAKLPPPVLDEAAKAKAAEAAAKTAWQGKMDAYLLCKAQDRVVAAYKRTAANRPAVAVPAGATTTVATAPAAGAAPAAAAPRRPCRQAAGADHHHRFARRQHAGPQRHHRCGTAGDALCRPGAFRLCPAGAEAAGNLRRAFPGSQRDQPA
jgi:hypothetical protein